MKPRTLVLTALGILFLGLVLRFSREAGPDPGNLGYWISAGADRSSPSVAALDTPEAEFFHGARLIRSNLVVRVDRVPMLSAIPVVGRVLFEEVTYEIDPALAPEVLAEAHRWIKRSADHGFAPAAEAEKLFAGRLLLTNGPASRTGAKP